MPLKKPVKRRRGRPPRTGPALTQPDGRIKFTTRLTPETIDLLRELGLGHANVGIERMEVLMRSALRRNKGGSRGD